MTKVDNRLVGETAENIFLSLINGQNILAVRFDTIGFDGIVFDNEKSLFKVGTAPFYVQIKCRGSNTSYFNPQGHSERTIQRINDAAKEMNIPQDSLYFVVGFFHNRDIRNIIFFGIPFAKLDLLKSASEYRFSVKRCRELLDQESGIFSV